MGPDRKALRRRLLAWFRRRKRDLPFRRTRDPYAILVAEVILQRTRIETGLRYYERFLAAFPTVRALAAAPESEVLRVWEGLGYYRRARNLHAAAKTVVEGFGGELPADFEALRALPGIGDYTAGAVGSIAFGLRVPAVDGNATRVLARVFGVEGDVSRASGRRIVRALAAELVPSDDPGTWNQALMEFGGNVCTPRAPACPSCPLAGECKALAAGRQEAIPMTPAKAPVPVVPVVFVVLRRGDSILLVRRQGNLHGGLYGLPGGEKRQGESDARALRRHVALLGVQAGPLRPLAPVRQAFSHRRWEGTAYVGRAKGRPRGAEWIPLDRLPRLPLVPLHRVLLAHATP